MHRQSLGSPATSKLQCSFSGAGDMKGDIDDKFISDHHRKDRLAPCLTTAASADDDEERKSQSQKSNLQKSIPVSSSPRLVHLIPLLTFFCFLILYLSSHDPDPSTKDLPQISGFTTAIDPLGVDDNVGGESVEIEKSGVLAIRSMRNLQQQEQHDHRLHRKFRR